MSFCYTSRARGNATGMARSPSDGKAPALTVLQALAVASQFGVSLAVSVVLGYFVGQWLDQRVHTGVLFTFIGVLLGLLGAVLGTIRLYRAALGRASNAHQPSATTPSSHHSANEGNPEDL
jgi:F0F1-type ATP synthase assembly protein I